MGKIAGDIYGGRMRSSPELVQKHMRHVRWSSDYGYYLQLMAGIGWTSLPWLGFLRQPTLVMAGKDDPIVPLANGRIMAKLIPERVWRLLRMATSFYSRVLENPLN